jgi:glycosyltransferase involved in cell wall biosynthesis
MGGAEYQAHVLAEELGKRSNVSVHYLARRTPEVPDPALPYEIRSIGSRKGFRRHGVFFDAPQLARTLRELQPDLIYEQMKQSYTAVCASYARRANIPFFLHIASEWDLNPAAVPFGFSKHTPFEVIEAVAGNWGLRRASHIIAQTAAQASKLSERFGREAAVLIRNFQPVPTVLPVRTPGPIRVLWVGNIKPVKRPELYVELARRFAGRNDVHFDMVGRPWQHPEGDKLLQEIAKLPNFKFHGELPIERVNELMCSAHLYVNTSAHEGFPNTYVQAWAHGAVLLSLVVDPYDGMEDLGIGFCTGTLERMQVTIEDLIRNPERRQAIAQRSFEFAHEKHSLAEGARLADIMLEAATRSTANPPGRSVLPPLIPPAKSAHVASRFTD